MRENRRRAQPLVGDQIVVTGLAGYSGTIANIATSDGRLGSISCCILTQGSSGDAYPYRDLTETHRPRRPGSSIGLTHSMVTSYVREALKPSVRVTTCWHPGQCRHLDFAFCAGRTLAAGTPIGLRAYPEVPVLPGRCSAPMRWEYLMIGCHPFSADRVRRGLADRNRLMS